MARALDRKRVAILVEDGFEEVALTEPLEALTDAGVLRGRKVTSYESIQTDLKSAGARWVDEEVVVDDGLVTSRKPSDLPAFNMNMIEEVAEGRHAQRRRAG